MKNELGLIHVYTGDGKGKTTAAIGMAVRACGQGMKVLMLQFLKGDIEYGEIKLFDKIPGFEIIQIGNREMADFAQKDPLLEKLIKDGWEMAKQKILSKKYDMVILDEMNLVNYIGIIPRAEVLDFLKYNNTHPVELVFTGRNASNELIQVADLVTEMKEIKHYYQKGVQSRIGIDH